MPWRQTSPMDQKMQFIADYLRQTLSIVELCELYGVSRKTGYKWITRYRKHGPLSLEQRSRQPPANAHACGRCPHRAAPSSPLVGRQETALNAPETASELAVTRALHGL